MESKEFKRLNESLIQVGLRIAKRGEGALFVVGNAEYQTLVDQKVPKFKVTENLKLLESLALMDGAVIIDSKGYLEAYGAMIKSRTPFKNFGTRHSAAISASRKGNYVLIISEEDKKIRILQNRRVVMEIDARSKDIRNARDVVNVLEAVGAGAIGTLGTTVIAPHLGLALLPGLIIFGGAYYILKNLSGRFVRLK